MPEYICRGRTQLQQVANDIAALEGGEWVISIDAVDDKPVRFCGPPGMSKHALYPVWNNMWERCVNQKHINYKHYGERGIRVSEEWRDFVQFLIDVGEKPAAEYSLDRIDVNGNYERGNVRWATRKEQSRNKRNTRYVEWRGEKKSLLEWSEITGIPYPVLQLRLDRRKWSAEQAFTTPLIPPGWQKGMRRGSRVGG